MFHASLLKYYRPPVVTGTTPGLVLCREIVPAPIMRWIALWRNGVSAWAAAAHNGSTWFHGPLYSVQDSIVMTTHVAYIDIHGMAPLLIVLVFRNGLESPSIQRIGCETKNAWVCSHISIVQNKCSMPANPWGQGTAASIRHENCHYWRNSFMTF